MKSLDTYDLTTIPSRNMMLVLEIAQCKFVLRRENVIALGTSGTGKIHVAIALGLAACQKGFSVAFTTAAGLVNQLMEACDERRLLKLQPELQAVKLLIVDELGHVPLSSTGAELLFEMLSQRYVRGSTIAGSAIRVRRSPRFGVHSPGGLELLRPFAPTGASRTACTGCATSCFTTTSPACGPNTSPENMATVKHLALYLLNKTAKSDSLKTRRIRSGWDDDLLQAVITQTA